MVRPKVINLDPYKDLINRMIRGHSSQQTILDSLHQEHGVSVSWTSLQSYLREWGLLKRCPNVRKSPALIEAVKGLVSEYDVTDKHVSRLLSSTKWGHVPVITVYRIRRGLGVRRQISADEQPEHAEQIRTILMNEFNDGRIENMGRGLLYRHLRMTWGNQAVIGRDRTYDIVRELYPEGVAQRHAKARIHRGHLVTPGPNYCWSADAYCKGEAWGIQIYGFIDVYSRKIVSIYVGITGRTAVSVLAQCIKTLRATGVMPQLLCGETPLVADAHYQLSSTKRSQADGSPLTFSQAFKFGISKQNSRIESWWEQNGRCTMTRWRGHFKGLVSDGDYIADSLADQVAFLAIYMPIIRHDVKLFVRLWNTHPIRKQRTRPYAVAGIPNLLYRYPECEHHEDLEANAERQRAGGQCGLPVFDGDLEAIERDLAPFDIDEYLPEDVLQWCDEQLDDAGFPLPITGRDHNADTGDKLHMDAYIYLQNAARLHVREHWVPQLRESEKPYHAFDWQPSNDLAQVFADAGVDMPFADECTDRELQALYG